MESKTKRTIKDSVFTNLFGKKKYTLELYKALFPDDSDDVTEDDIEIITLENVISTSLYNDLGFSVKNRLIILAEAQSTWSENIVVRMLLYLANTYKGYIDGHDINLYSAIKAKLPVSELFVIYTGDKKNLPDTISLADSFFGGKNTIDINVKVLTNGRNNDIIAQYVKFTRVINDQIKLYGYTKRAVQEAIRICKDEDVLREYLSHCEEEVIDMMDLLFNQERIQELHDKEVKNEGIAIGMERGIEKERNETLELLRESGMSEEYIDYYLLLRKKKDRLKGYPA